MLQHSRWTAIHHKPPVTPMTLMNRIDPCWQRTPTLAFLSLAQSAIRRTHRPDTRPRRGLHCRLFTRWSLSVGGPWGAAARHGRSVWNPRARALDQILRRVNPMCSPNRRISMQSGLLIASVLSALALPCRRTQLLLGRLLPFQEGRPPRNQHLARHRRLDAQEGAQE